jgi:hypothetical protein
MKGSSNSHSARAAAPEVSPSPGIGLGVPIRLEAGHAGPGGRSIETGQPIARHELDRYMPEHVCRSPAAYAVDTHLEYGPWSLRHDRRSSQSPSC